jgi:hypothetical protein
MSVRKIAIEATASRDLAPFLRRDENRQELRVGEFGRKMRSLLAAGPGGKMLICIGD